MGEDSDMSMGGLQPVPNSHLIPVLDIIKSGQYDKLHILTHAIWYNEDEEDIHETIKKFVTSANRERYFQEKENIKDIESILEISEI